MENRDRDKMNRDTEGTDGGDLDRKKSESDADFGEDTARTERMYHEPNRRQAGFLGDGRSDVGRTGSKNNNDH
ncbi:MAG: hypothetical protein ACXV7D_16410 [Thermoanaerobaculia bacterium]